MLFKYFLFLFILRSSSASDALPVFIIDHDNVLSHIVLPTNPFETVKKEFFIEIVLDGIKKSECIIIFAEETLSSEEISVRDHRGTPFYNMQKDLRERKMFYVPSVASPYRTLTQYLKPQPSNTKFITFGTNIRLSDIPKYLYFYFNDATGLSRIDNFRKHDMMMKEVYFTVRQLKAGPVIAFYTGKVNPVTIEPVRYEAVRSRAWDQTDSGVIVMTPDALFRLSGVFAASQTRRSSFDAVPVLQEEIRTRRTMSTTMTYHDFELQFNFRFGEDDWQIDNVVLLEGGEEVGRTQMMASAPWNSSYFCSEPLTVVNARDGSAITVSEYQIQPIYRDSLRRSGNESNASLTCFGKTVNCGPYFNTHILSGLLVAFLIFCITMWGIIMLFNCESNSRFDDPQGKTIVIPASSN